METEETTVENNINDGKVRLGKYHIEGAVLLWTTLC